MRSPGGTLCAGIRRLAGKPFVRRLTGFPNVLRPGQTGQTVITRCVLRTQPADFKRQGEDVQSHEMLDVVMIDGKAAASLP